MPSGIVTETKPMKFIDNEEEQTSSSFTSHLVNIRDIFINRIKRILEGEDYYNWCDMSTVSQSQVANATVVVDTPVEDDTVTINTLVYTARDTLTGAAGEFLIGGSDIDTANNLRDAINDDTRVGGVGYVFATTNGAETTIILGSSITGAAGSNTEINTDVATLQTNPASGNFNSGTSGTDNLFVMAKTLRVPIDENFSFVKDFFDEYADGGANFNKVVAIPLRNTSKFVYYAVFLVFDASLGSGPVDVFYGTVTAPDPSGTEALTPDFPNIPSGFVRYGEAVVARSIKGGQQVVSNSPDDEHIALTRVYDYFILGHSPQVTGN